MASHVSSEKRARQTVRRTARNQAIIGRVRSAIRAFRQALGGPDGQKLKESFDVAARALRKAASKGVLHQRNADRRVSRLHQAFNKVAAKASSQA